MRALILTVAALWPATAAIAQPVDTVPRIAVVSAFEPEWQLLRAEVDRPEEHVLNGNRFVAGTLGGQDVVLFLSGISMVNAAMTTQLALDHFAIDGIVVSGIAGGVDPDRSIGDVVVAGRWGQYLETILARETDGGFAIPPFLSSDFPNYGMIHTQSVGVMRDGAGEVERRFWFPASADWLDVAAAVAEDVMLADCTGDGTCLDTAPRVVVGGNGVSGSAFVDNADFRHWVHGTFGAQVLDMETAAIPHVAYANDVPYIAFRSLSDLAGGGAEANEMETFFRLAADNSAMLVEAFLAALD